MVIVEMRVALEHVICVSSAATSGDKHEKHKLKQNMRDILGCSLRNVRLGITQIVDVRDFFA